MGLLYIIISLLLNDDVHSVFDVKNSPNRLSWENAVVHCNSKSNSYIAVPTVNLTTMRITDAIALNEEAWVGYFKSYEHFLFIDCVPLSVINSVAYARYNIGRNNNRPGMCYSLCGLQEYIGLQDGNCYCIDAKNFSAKNTIPFKSTCTIPLQCGNGMLCGYEEHSMISVYMNVSMSSMSSRDMKGDGSGCLLVSKDKDYEMSVVDCTSKYRHLCEAQIGQTLSLEESEETEPWLHSMKYCGETFKRPTTFLGDTTRYIFPNISRSWWATVVRDLVIRNCSETCTKIEKPLYEGYLKKSSDDGIKLEFVQAKDKSVKKSVACMSGETGKTYTSVPATTPTTSKATTTTFVSGEKMNISTTAKTVKTPERSSSVPATTPTTSKSTITTFMSGEKMNISTTAKTVKTPERSSSVPATTPTSSKSTITTFMSGETRKYTTSGKTVTTPERSSSVPATTPTTSKSTKTTFVSGETGKTSTSVPATTPTTSKATTTTFVSGEIRKYTTRAAKIVIASESSSTDPATTPTTSKSTITTFVSESTVDLSVLLAVVGSVSSLLVVSILLNIYFIRKRRRFDHHREYTNTVLGTKGIDHRIRVI